MIIYAKIKLPNGSSVVKAYDTFGRHRRLCSTVGCPNVKHTKGMCRKHYQVNAKAPTVECEEVPAPASLTPDRTPAVERSSTTSNLSEGDNCHECYCKP